MPSPLGDLRKVDQVKEACKGVEVVFHCATAAPTGAGALNKELMDGVNVEGTRNVITACHANGVKRLVATSSASVVFEGKTLRMVDEKHDYARRPMDYYTETKFVSAHRRTKTNQLASNEGIDLNGWG